MKGELVNVGAAPHLPAGIFSPLNGEKGAVASAFANRRRCRREPALRPASFSPFTGRNARQGNEGQRRRSEVLSN